MIEEKPWVSQSVSERENVYFFIYFWDFCGLENRVEEKKKRGSFCKRRIKKIKDRNHPLLFSFTSHSLWRLCLLNTLPSLSLSLSLVFVRFLMLIFHFSNLTWGLHVSRHIKGWCVWLVYKYNYAYSRVSELKSGNKILREKNRWKGDFFSLSICYCF